MAAQLAAAPDVRSETPPVLMLAEVLDLRAAGPLHQEILARRGESIRIDASAVRRLGGLCLQVLLCAVAAWREDGQRLTFLNPSPGFVEGLELLGVHNAAA